MIENDCGPVNIDAALLESQASWVLELTDGCACCTLGAELASALEALAPRAAEFDHLVLEASGIADPFAILRAFQGPAARAAFVIDHVVTVVDRRRDPDLVTDRWLWERQVRLADTIAFSHADALPTEQSARCTGAVARLNPSARCLDAARVDPAALLHGPASSRGAGKHLPRFSAGAPATTGLDTIAVMEARPMLEARVRELLEQLVDDPHAPAMRAKGLLRVVGSDRRYVAQAANAQVTIERTRLAAPQRSQLVVIGAALDAATIEEAFRACAAPGQ